MAKAQIWNGEHWESIDLSTGSNASKTVGSGSYAKTINVDYPTLDNRLFDGAYLTRDFYKNDPSDSFSQADSGSAANLVSKRY